MSMQLAGLWYISTKRAEIEVSGYHVNKEKWGRIGCWRVLTRSKEPTNASVKYAIIVISGRNDH